MAVNAAAMTGGAIFSRCQRYRYALWRNWSGHIDAPAYALFVALNPSTADATHDDPTIRRCIGYARAWGYDGVYVVNLFAYRATDPRVLLAQPDPVGGRNDHYLRKLARGAHIVVAAWGTRGTHLGRDKCVRTMLPQLQCLRLTRDGHPAHPLYLPGGLLPVALPDP
jgi:hypothetical protein